MVQKKGVCKKGVNKATKRIAKLRDSHSNWRKLGKKIVNSIE